MTLSVDLYWSFRSPYSYLATGRVVDLERQYDMNVNVRPVYPLAIRNPEFFRTSNRLWVPYLLKDIERVAEFHGLPIAMPQPDPIVQNLETLEISKDQPYIRRLTRLGMEAVRTGAGLPFIHEVSTLIWGGAVQGWDQGDHLANAVKLAGLDLADLERAIDGRGEDIDAEIQANQDALENAGHWGVPTLVFEGEPFFGQDRIDVCLWRLKQKGLVARN